MTTRISRMRHLRHRRLDGVTRGAEGAKGIPRLKHVEAWLAGRADTAANGGIGDTAVTDNFTASGSVMTAAAHGLTTPSGPFVLTTTGTLPAGLSLTVLVWARAVTTGTLSFHSTRDGATFNTSAITTTSAGTGTHSFARAADIPGLIEWLRQNNDPLTIQALTDIDDL